jgi:Nucleotidyl transferase of unknown function (DUF2204)
MTPDDALLRLLARFRDEGVEYVLIGGQAVRLNGYLRATEDVDVLIKATAGNGQRIIRAMSFLDAAKELNAAWFVPDAGGDIENIRVADDLLVDLLFRANGQSFESMQPYIRELVIEGTPIKVLNIEGLIMTKTDYREKDVLDKQVLQRIRAGLRQGE